MEIERLQELAEELLEKPGGNYVEARVAITPDQALMKMFDRVVLGVADAADPFFDKCLEEHVVGPHFRKPDFWLPKARSVLSVFFVFTPRVVRSNAAAERWPSHEWLHARIEGQKFISYVMDALRAELDRKGYDTVVPSDHARFESVNESQSNRRLSGMSYTSNWSERHVAYACGLGTFGLSRGLITKDGMAGRFGSLVTTLGLPPTPRGYDGPYDYCSMCGACARNCPVNAITLETGKNQTLCAMYVAKTKAKFSPRYGCGKCQVDVPCQGAAPGG